MGTLPNRGFQRYFGVSRFFRLEIPTRAAALAFHTLLSIVPIVGILFWYLMTIGVTEKWLNFTKRFIITQLNLEASGTFLDLFDKLTEGVGGQSWGYVGLVVLLYTAWNLVSRFGGSLDVILDLREHRVSPVWLALRRLLAMLVLPIALTLSLVVTQWIQSDSWLKNLFKIRIVGPAFALPLAWAAGIAACFLMYWLIPARRSPWRQALKAAVIVAPASEVLRYLFGIYSRHIVLQVKLYGIFVVVPLFFLWVQLSWMLLLSGALVMRTSNSDPP